MVSVFKYFPLAISMSVFGTAPSDVLKAARLLNYGKVIALPTDTIYGLAALVQDNAAVDKLYKIKGRDCSKPVAICVSNIDDVGLWGQASELPNDLLAALLPGPVTIVLNRTERLNPALNPNTTKVGIRIPDHPFIQDVMKLLESPIALTSANRSNEPSCLEPLEFMSLWPQVAGVFHAGVIGKFRSGSTVVDLTENGVYRILRSGSALDETCSILHSFHLKQTFDDVLSGLSGREGLVKEELTNQLSSSVKEIQLDQANRDDKTEPLGTDDVTSSLCIVLEAIFIHGLKDTFINRVSQAIGANDVDQRPEPTFWSPLLVFSHREIIDQVNGLFLVSTDVGRSRAWIRLALNDGLLSSYLSAMRRENAALKPYYQTKSFLRDTELLDVAQRLIEGVDNYPFALACNSSLLNTWTNQPLLLAGLWTPPLGTCPVTSGIDVASTLVTDQFPRALMDSPPSYIGSSLGLDEDEALKIILGTPVSKPPLSLDTTRPTDIPGVSGQPPRTQETGEEECHVPGTSLGNSLTGRLGWSSSFEELPTSDTPHPAVETPIVATVKSPSDFQSYHSLVESYNLVSGSHIKTPDLRDFMQRFQDMSLDQTCSASEVDDLTGLGFEVIPTSPTSLFNIPDFTNLVHQLGKLGLERGLDNQNYACESCNHPIGINLGPANVCSFTGSYYCMECQKGDEWVVPARIIHNWDYRRYAVCRKAASFLEEVQHHPLIDLKALNPRLYLVVSEMAQLQGLRIQLNLLRGYLYTCREPIIEELQKRVWPREYLYEHVHLYSVADLLQIPSGALAQLLARVVNFARDHVLTCWLCSQKGFICEVCNNNKVIYPFDTDSTYRCIACSAVFHSACMDSTKPCPKCLRKQQRTDSPLLETAGN